MFHFIQHFFTAKKKYLGKASISVISNAKTCPNIRRLYKERMIALKIREIMTTDVRTVSANDSISEAANIMKQLDVGAIPVLDNQILVGIITDRDLVLRAVAEGKNSEERVSTIMTKDITSVNPDMDVHKVADLMASKQIRRLPIVENGSLVGIVSIGDMAVEDIFENEAGEALHTISMGVRH
jgi:CBS domain-containing protein